MAAPTVARSARGASARSANCHQSSPEYSTLFEREDAQPGGAGEHERDGGGPTRSEARHRQVGLAVEVQPAGQQRHEHSGEQQRLFVVDALGEREDDAGAEQRAGEHPRGVEPPLQAAREQQQHHPDEAAQEVRQLDDRQRQQVLQPAQPLQLGRCGAGEEQHGAGQEGGEGEDVRYERRHPGGDRAGGALHADPLAQQLVAAEQQGRGAQRQQVVDGAIEQQRAEHGRARCRGGREQQQHRGLEDAETGGHLAQESGGLRQQEDGEEAGEAEAGKRRQQHPERDAGERPIEGGDGRGAGGEGGRRQAKLPAAHREGRPPPRAEGEKGGDGEQQHGAERTARRERQVRRRRRPQRREQEGDAGEGRVAEPERHLAEADDGRRLVGGEAPAGVEAVAQRAAGEQRVAGGVGERLAEE